MSFNNMKNVTREFKNIHECVKNIYDCFDRDEYEEETEEDRRGEESFLQTYVREVGSALAKDFYNIVVKGK